MTAYSQPFEDGLHLQAVLPTSKFNQRDREGRATCIGRGRGREWEGRGKRRGGGGRGGGRGGEGVGGEGEEEVREGDSVQPMNFTGKRRL